MPLRFVLWTTSTDSRGLICSNSCVSGLQRAPVWTLYLYKKVGLVQANDSITLELNSDNLRFCWKASDATKWSLSWVKDVPLLLTHLSSIFSPVSSLCLLNAKKRKEKKSHLRCVHGNLYKVNQEVCVLASVWFPFTLCFNALLPRSKCGKTISIYKVNTCFDNH